MELLSEFCWDLQAYVYNCSWIMMFHLVAFDVNKTWLSKCTVNILLQKFQYIIVYIYLFKSLTLFYRYL